MNITPFEFEVKLTNAFKIKATQLAVVTEGDDVIGMWPVNPGDTPMNDIIQADQDLMVKAAWSVSGALASIVCGEYITTVYCERMGKLEVNEDFSVKVPHVQTAACTNYSATITIPKNTLGEGVYRLVVAINFRSEKDLPIPVAGFCDLGLMQVYQAD